MTDASSLLSNKAVDKPKAPKAGSMAAKALISQALTDGDWVEMFQMAKEKAIKGNLTALKFLAEYCFGKPEQNITMGADSSIENIQFNFSRPTPSELTMRGALADAANPPSLQTIDMTELPMLNGGRKADEGS